MIYVNYGILITPRTKANATFHARCLLFIPDVFVAIINIHLSLDEASNYV